VISHEFSAKFYSSILKYVMFRTNNLVHFLTNSVVLNVIYKRTDVVQEMTPLQ
jgi:hypothetical protein